MTLEFLRNLDWQELLDSYGYLAIFIGTFLEGETIVILGGMLVAGGQMSLEGVIISAFAGSSLSDQLMFSLGKYKGSALLKRFPRIDRKRKRVSRLLAKYDAFLILGFRFIYGIRNVTPIILGLSRITHRRFLILNLIGTAIWAVLFTGGGYYFGHAVFKIVKVLGISILYLIIGAGILAGACYFFIRRRRLRKSSNDCGQ